MLGILQPNEIEGVLHSEAIGRIGVSTNGHTYVVPVTYAYDGEQVICHSTDGLKIRMMRSNPEVCFEVEHVDNLANWKCVIAWGDFRELHGGEAAAGMGLLVEKLRPKMPSSSPGEAHSVTPTGELGMPVVIYAIKLKEKTGRFERR